MARRRRTWRELDPAQRTRIVDGGVVQVALQVAAPLDLRRRPIVRAVRRPVRGVEDVQVAAVPQRARPCPAERRRLETRCSEGTGPSGWTGARLQLGMFSAGWHV